MYEGDRTGEVEVEKVSKDMTVQLTILSPHAHWHLVDSQPIDLNYFGVGVADKPLSELQQSGCSTPAACFRSQQTDVQWRHRAVHSLDMAEYAHGWEVTCEFSNYRHSCISVFIDCLFWIWTAWFAR